MKKEYHSEIMEAIHEEAQALYDAGAIDKARMTEYDLACLDSKSGVTAREPVLIPAYAQKC